MKFSVLIPARNERDNLPGTINAVRGVLKKAGADFEIVVVDDSSTDDTPEVLSGLQKEVPELVSVHNPPPNGFGLAVRRGFERVAGDAVCIMMADGSDSAEDMMAYYSKINEGYDCVFGSRFIKGSRLIDYPIHKLILNRLGNYFIGFFIGVRHNDITNAFKCYRTDVIKGVEPLFSNHFNLTVELPLKAIIRGYSFATVPIRWTNRAHGVSKFKIKEMGSRYLFIIFYIFLEKHLSRGDYLKRGGHGRK